jgi:hypothetical protein
LQEDLIVYDCEMKQQSAITIRFNDAELDLIGLGWHVQRLDSYWSFSKYIRIQMTGELRQYAESETTPEYLVHHNEYGNSRKNTVRLWMYAPAKLSLDQMAARVAVKPLSLARQLAIAGVAKEIDSIREKHQSECCGLHLPCPPSELELLFKQYGVSL